MAKPSSIIGNGEEDETYAGELFLMAVGALFLGFNVAPTDEMMLISYQMTEWHALGLLCLSIALMHGFVFASDLPAAPMFRRMRRGGARSCG